MIIGLNNIKRDLKSPAKDSKKKCIFKIEN
jgi:hypothetical protein